MTDNRPVLTDRTVLVGVLISVVAVALCAAILVVAVRNASVKQEVRLVGIVTSPQTVWLDDVGDSERLSVRGYYSDRSVAGLDDGSGATVSYASTDPSVARVDSDGVVTGVKTGGADVMVSYGNLSAAVPVFVWGPAMEVPPIDPAKLLDVDDDGSAIVLNRVMVELEPGYDLKDASLVASEIDGQVVFEFRTFPGYLVEFTARTAEDLEEALAVLQADQRVAQAYPDLALSANNEEDVEEVIETLLLPTDKKWTYLQAGMENAWRTMNLVDNLSTVNIAVVDAGFVRQTGDADVDAALTSEFDYDRIRFPFGMGDFNLLGIRPADPFGVNPPDHGNTVAGVIVARNNDRNDDSIPEDSFSGIVTSVDGLDYNLILYSVPTGLRFSAARITSALEHMALYKNQIDVVNMSIGFQCEWYNPVYCLGGYFWRNRWLELMKVMPDVAFVFSAGNSGKDAGNAVPAKLSLDLPNAITVGATWYDERADFSNFGPAITLGAPGLGVWTVNVEEPTGYGYTNGTSFAAPMVSGTVALLRALDPELSSEEIKHILVNTGGSHSVCTSNEAESPPDPCPPGDRETWAILNAEEAVSSVLWPSTDAEINSQAVQPTEATLGSYVELTIPVVNTGSRAWNFHMDGVAHAPFQPDQAEYELEPVNNVVPAGGSHPFKLGFWANEVGEWVVQVKIYRNPERTSSPDSKILRLKVVPPPSASAATAPAAGQPGTSPVAVPSTPAGVLRADANVLVLADTSGSMEGEKNAKLKSSILEFVGRIDDPGEYIGLIDFDDDVEEVVPLGPFGSDLGPWNVAVEQLDGDGGTAFFDAVAHAVTVLEGQGAPDRSNIIIALTDGNDEDSRRTASEVISELQGASVPIILFALAYGEDDSAGGDYDLEVLERLAESTGGVAYAGTPEDVERLFTLLSTLF